MQIINIDKKKRNVFEPACEHLPKTNIDYGRGPPSIYKYKSK